MFCFFICDINVGLFNALGKDGMTLIYSILHVKGIAVKSSKAGILTEVAIMIPFTIRSIIGILVWFFYLPAQFLLTLSGFRLEFIRSVYPVIPELNEPEQ